MEIIEDHCHDKIVAITKELKFRYAHVKRSRSILIPVEDGLVEVSVKLDSIEPPLYYVKLIFKVNFCIDVSGRFYDDFVDQYIFPVIKSIKPISDEELVIYLMYSPTAIIVYKLDQSIMEKHIAILLLERGIDECKTEKYIHCKEYAPVVFNYFAYIRYALDELVIYLPNNMANIAHVYLFDSYLEW